MGIFDGIKETMERKKKERDERQLQQLDERARKEESEAKLDKEFRVRYERIAEAKQSRVRLLEAKEKIGQADSAIFQRKIAPIAKLVGAANTPGNKKAARQISGGLLRGVDVFVGDLGTGFGKKKKSRNFIDDMF